MISAILKILCWFGVHEEDIAKLKDGHQISYVKLDDEHPPVEVLYTKYGKVKPFFETKAWSTIEEHSMLYRNICTVFAGV